MDAAVDATISESQRTGESHSVTTEANADLEKSNNHSSDSDSDSSDKSDSEGEDDDNSAQSVLTQANTDLDKSEEPSKSGSDNEAEEADEKSRGQEEDNQAQYSSSFLSSNDSEEEKVDDIEQEEVDDQSRGQEEVNDSHDSPSFASSDSEDPSYAPDTNEANAIANETELDTNQPESSGDKYQDKRKPKAVKSNTGSKRKPTQDIRPNDDAPKPDKNAPITDTRRKYIRSLVIEGLEIPPDLTAQEKVYLKGVRGKEKQRHKAVENGWCLRCKTAGHFPVAPNKHCQYCLDGKKPAARNAGTTLPAKRGNKTQATRRAAKKAKATIAAQQEPSHDPDHPQVMSPPLPTTIAEHYSSKVYELLQELREPTIVKELPVLADNLKNLPLDLDSELPWARYDKLLNEPEDSAGDSNRILRDKTSVVSAALGEGWTIPGRYGVIVLEDSVDQPKQHFQQFKDRLQAAYMGQRPEYQDYSKKGGISEIPMRDFLDDIDLRTSSTEEQTVYNPKNFLSWNKHLNTLGSPPFLHQMGFLVLEFLCDRIRNQWINDSGQRNAAGKEYNNQNERYADMESCLKFCIYGERGAASSWHMDILNGTWVSCITGIKLWLVYTGPWTEEVKAEFQSKGVNWKPPKDTIQIMVLTPGDTLIMRPGYPIIHAVVTLEDSLMMGGMMWASDNIACTMENIMYIMSDPGTTNEAVPAQFPEFVDELEVFLNEQGRDTDDVDVKAVRALKAAAKPRLSCQCKKACHTKGNGMCPCWSNGYAKRVGCTCWCHGEQKDSKKKCYGS
jgi:hypothetical protein